MLMLRQHGILRRRESYAHLNEKAWQQCLMGCNRLIQKHFSLSKKWLMSSDVIPSKTCVLEGGCGPAKAHAVFSLPSMDPDFILTQILEPLQSESQIRSVCTPCSASLAQAHYSARKDIWNELPMYFDLPEWGQLQDFA